MASLTVFPSAITNITGPLLRWGATRISSDSDSAAAYASGLVPSPLKYYPAYHSDAESLIPGLSDLYLSLLAPIVAYWVYALFFHWMDTSGLFERLRIHEPTEITQRNKVSVGHVVRMVIVQHAMQTAFGVLALDQETAAAVDHRAEQVNYAYWMVKAVRFLLHRKIADRLLSNYGTSAVTFVYWWAIPIIQFCFASFILDTWQYFVHRAFHVNKFLYRRFHSWHHRLYVPYAFGALYNHPFEGIFMDTGGAGLAHFIARLSTRQDMLLFTLASMKTVDDHCGFNLPWDPFQFLFGNNADCEWPLHKGCFSLLDHDIHHQQFGIKKNFAQPYFTHWDRILGTRMTRDQAPRRRHTDQRDPLVKTGEAVPVMPNEKKDL